MKRWQTGSTTGSESFERRAAQITLTADPPFRCRVETGSAEVVHQIGHRGHDGHLKVLRGALLLSGASETASRLQSPQRFRSGHLNAAIGVHFLSLPKSVGRESNFDATAGQPDVSEVEKGTRYKYTEGSKYFLYFP